MYIYHVMFGEITHTAYLLVLISDTFLAQDLYITLIMF